MALAIVPAMEEVIRMRPRPRPTMSLTMYLVKCSSDRTFSRTIFYFLCQIGFNKTPADSYTGIDSRRIDRPAD
jgi:hypothetical protein